MENNQNYQNKNQTHYLLKVLKFIIWYHFVAVNSENAMHMNIRFGEIR